MVTNIDENNYNTIKGGLAMELEKTDVTEPLVVFKSYIKLIKNSRGINWEIKLLINDDLTELKEKALKLHHELEQEFTTDI